MSSETTQPIEDGLEELVYRIDKGDFLNRKGNCVLYSELSETGSCIDHGFLNINMWFWGEKRFRGGVFWDDAPEGELKRRFPFCKYVQVFAATGGEYAGHAGSFLNRDLYQNPAHPEEGYDFEPILHYCGNILRQGMKPYLKLCYVPPALSEDFARSPSFFTNKRPPTDFNRYYGYLLDILNALKECYGVEELRSWKWGGPVEIDNADWFSTADGSEESSKKAAFMLYDCTVAAVEAVLGEGQADIGPHVCFCYWSPELLIRHCAEDINPFTQKKGTAIRFIALSCYQSSVENPDDQAVRKMALLKEWADKYGFTDIAYQFDEGDMLFGADGLNLMTTTFASQPWAISKRARDFKQALDRNWDAYYAWAFTTFGGSGIWNDGKTKDSNLKGANYGFTNVFLLANRMYGSTRQSVARGGLPVDPEDNVDAVIGYDRESARLYILVFNHNENMYSRSEEHITVRLARAALEGSCTAKKWQVDEDHADFFKTWWNERGKNARYEQSVFDGTFPRILVDETDKQYWRENEERYARLSTLGEPVDHPVERVGHQLVIQDDIANHGVIFYELDGISLEK